MKNLKDLKARALELTAGLPLMEGREKGEMKTLANDETFTIREFGFIKENDSADYVVFTIDEDNKNFYFGGQVLTENMHTMEDEGYSEVIFKEGLPVKFEERRSKNKRTYIACEFFPQ